MNRYTLIPPINYNYHPQTLNTYTYNICECLKFVDDIMVPQ